MDDLSGYFIITVLLFTITAVSVIFKQYKYSLLFGAATFIFLIIFSDKALSYSVSHNRVIEAVKNCEQDLPRNTSCEVVITAKIKNVGR